MPIIVEHGSGASPESIDRFGSAARYAGQQFGDLRERRQESEDRERTFQAFDAAAEAGQPLTPQVVEASEVPGVEYPTHLSSEDVRLLESARTPMEKRAVAQVIEGRFQQGKLKAELQHADALLVQDQSSGLFEAEEAQLIREGLASGQVRLKDFVQLRQGRIRELAAAQARIEAVEVTSNWAQQQIASLDEMGGGAPEKAREMLVEFMLEGPTGQMDPAKFRAKLMGALYPEIGRGMQMEIEDANAAFMATIADLNQRLAQYETMLAERQAPPAAPASEGAAPPAAGGGQSVARVGSDVQASVGAQGQAILQRHGGDVTKAKDDLKKLAAQAGVQIDPAFMQLAMTGSLEPQKGSGEPGLAGKIGSDLKGMVQMVAEGVKGTGLPAAAKETFDAALDAIFGPPKSRPAKQPKGEPSKQPATLRGTQYEPAAKVNVTAQDVIELAKKAPKGFPKFTPHDLRAYLESDPVQRSWDDFRGWLEGRR